MDGGKRSVDAEMVLAMRERSTEMRGSTAKGDGRTLLDAMFSCVVESVVDGVAKSCSVATGEGDDRSEEECTDRTRVDASLVAAT